MKWHFLFISLLQGQAFPKFISGPFFMGTVKYSFGKERRQNSQTVYCTFPWFLGGLANVSWSCLTKEMPGLPLTPRSLSLQARRPTSSAPCMGKCSHPSCYSRRYNMLEFMYFCWIQYYTMLLSLVLNYHHLLLMLKYNMNNESIIMTFQNSLFTVCTNCLHFVKSYIFFFWDPK